MTAEGITPAVTAWAERTVPGARVTGAAVRPLAGGSVARWVEQLTLHLSGGHAPLELVRKEAAALEIAGLGAAQAARADDTAIPELVAHGSDWGGSRVGPAALDLANLVTADSADVTRYAGKWLEHTGRPLPADAIELGYRWAALQIPVQYLPWGAGHRPTADVEAALDRIEQAVDRLSG